MSWLKDKLTGGVSLDKLVDKISSGVDGAIFSNEERAEIFMEYYKLTLNENSIRSKTRRLIAILIISVYLLAFILVIALALMKIEEVNNIKDIVNEFRMNDAFMLVCSFFFGSYMLDKFMKQYSKREKKKDG